MVSTSRYPVSTFLILAGTSARKTLTAFTALLFALTCVAQDRAQAPPQPPSTPEAATSAQPPAKSPPVTLPAGYQNCSCAHARYSEQIHASRRRPLCPDHFSGQFRQPDGDSARHICPRYGRQAPASGRARGTTSSIHVDNLPGRLRRSDSWPGDAGKRRGLRTERSWPEQDDWLRCPARSRRWPWRIDWSLRRQFAKQYNYQLAPARLHRTTAILYFFQPKRSAQQGGKHRHRCGSRRRCRFRGVAGAARRLSQFFPRRWNTGGNDPAATSVPGGTSSRRRSSRFCAAAGSPAARRQASGSAPVPKHRCAEPYLFHPRQPGNTGYCDPRTSGA